MRDRKKLLAHSPLQGHVPSDLRTSCSALLLKGSAVAQKPYSGDQAFSTLSSGIEHVYYYKPCPWLTGQGGRHDSLWRRFS